MVKKSSQHIETTQEEKETELDQLLKSLPSTSAGRKATCTTSVNQSAEGRSAGEESAVESHKPLYTEKLQF